MTVNPAVNVAIMAQLQRIMHAPPSRLQGHRVKRARPGRCPGSQQRRSLCNPFIGSFGLKGAYRVVETAMSAPFKPKPLIVWFQGLRPWRVQGRALALPASPDRPAVDSLGGKPLANRLFPEIVLQAAQSPVVTQVP